jgi:hypothetical protein
MDAIDDTRMAELFDFGEASRPVALDGNQSLAMAIPDLAGFDGIDEQW